MTALAPVVAVVVVTLVTVGVGAVGLRVSRTTSDLLVASRTVSPRMNAAAISGEYLSAASFLGVAGLVLAYGADMLWFPVGYAAGYLVLLVLVAAPLRRSGAYTLPDFAEARLRSLPVRRAASLLVVGIGWLYLLPQLQGAGLTLRTVTGAPVWVGAVGVAAVVTLTVAGGGMRSITLVQAVQYWLKLTAIGVPAVILLLAWQGDGAPSLRGDDVPRFRVETTVTSGAPREVVVGEAVTVTGSGPVDGVLLTGTRLLPPGPHRLDAGSRVVFAAGAAVPHQAGIDAATDAAWAQPLSGAGGREHPLYGTWSIVLATFLGTMGLPHVLARFYTNPDGQAARRTALSVLVLLGAFYLFPTVFGALGREYAPDLLLTGQTDAVVLVLPARLLPGLLGELLGAVVVAGAFAAFLSTSSGLVVSVAGVLSQDVLPRRLGGVRSFRYAAVIAGAVPLVLAGQASVLPLSTVVGLAFAVAASSFCPLLVLGIWWRGLTDAGALAGLCAGGGLAGAAVLLTIVGVTPGGWGGALLTQPAVWTVPIAFAVMVVVSRATADRIPPGVDRFLLRLHAPEDLRP